MDSNTAVLDYKKSKDYWANISATNDGVLGGFGSISDIDIKDSIRFLKMLRKRDSLKLDRALDVGAGIGRVTKDLLSRCFVVVDLLEQDQKFIDEAKRIFQNEDNGLCDRVNFFCSGLMDFCFPGVKYDIIWIQWVLCYLTDDDLVEFLRRCSTWLNQFGVIVVKENMSKVEEGEIDESDSSITRSCSQYCELFKRANLEIVLKSQQRNFPQGLYKVLMFALKPKDA